MAVVTRLLATSGNCWAHVKTQRVLGLRHCVDDHLPWADQKIQAFLNPDRNGRQRRSLRISKLLLRTWGEHHSQKVAFDKSTGILHTTTDDPVQLMRVTFTSFTDSPCIHINAGLGWVKFPEIIKQFRAALGVAQPAVWQMAS